MQALTYLAQVRQLPFKNVWLPTARVVITPHISPIKPCKKRGMSHRVTVTIGIVLVAVWEGQNRSTGEWSRDVGYLRKIILSTSSQSLVGERK